MLNDASTRALLGMPHGPSAGDKAAAEQKLLDRAMDDYSRLFTMDRIWILDRNFPGAARIARLTARTHVLIRLKSDIRLKKVSGFLPDGSYLAEIAGAGPSTGPMLRSKTPGLVRQELAAWAAAVEMTRGAARDRALAAAPARKGRRAGQPVQAREISFTATRRAVIAAIRHGAGQLRPPGQRARQVPYRHRRNQNQGPRAHPKPPKCPKPHGIAGSPPYPQARESS